MKSLAVKRVPLRWILALKELSPAAARRQELLCLPDKHVRRLERGWHEHLRNVIAAPDSD